MTTPTEALATALHGSGHSPDRAGEPMCDWCPKDAQAILAALPEGWHMIDGTALLGELGESPLPGARYAYEVVKRVAETGR